MQISDDMEADILTWDISELWKNFREIAEETDSNEELMLVKHGINLKCDIRFITKECYAEYPKTKKVRIQGYGTYNIHEFWDEMEKREDIMREVLLANLVVRSSTKPRVD